MQYWKIGKLGKKIGKIGKKKWCLIYAFIFLLNPLFQYSIIPVFQLPILALFYYSIIPI
jgi:hypothetical protein